MRETQGPGGFPEHRAVLADGRVLVMGGFNYDGPSVGKLVLLG